MTIKRLFIVGLVVTLLLAATGAAAGTQGPGVLSGPTALGPNYRWHTFYGAASEERGEAVATDSSGNVYVTGESGSSWLGDGDTAPLHAHTGGGYYNPTILKLSPQGAYQWHTFYGRGFAYGIAVDDAANVYVAGSSSVSWLGDGGQSPLHPFSSGNSSDAMILKLDQDGAYQWHTFYGPDPAVYDESAIATDLALDAEANLYVVGLSGRTWNGDGGAAPLDPWAEDDMFVLKLDKDGAYQWHTFVGPVDDSYMYPSVAVDGNGQVYIAFEAPATWLGPGGQSPIHPHSGGSDNLGVLSLDAAGAYRWHTFYGPAAPGGIAAGGGSPADVYVTGISQSWLGDGGAPPIHAHSGGGDLIVLKLDGAGAYQWHTYYGPTTSMEGPRGREIAVGAGGREVYVTGESRFEWNGDGNTPPLHPWTEEYASVTLKLSADGAYRWHTFYAQETGRGVAAGPGDAVYVAGFGYASWLGDGGEAPLHPFSTAFEFSVIALMPLNSVYVDPAGTCGGQVPCYTSLAAALAALGPGDTLYIYPGTYAESLDLSAMALPGDLHVVTVDAAGTPTPGTATIAPPTGPAIYTSTRLPGDVSIDGLIVVAADDDGVQLAAEGDISIVNVVANNCGGDGLDLDAGGSVSIESSTANGNAESGFQVVAGDDVTIRRVTANDNAQAGIEVTAAGGTVSVLDSWTSGNGSQGVALGNVGGAATVGGNILCANATGLELTTAITATAEANWWGCPGGPGTAGCDTLLPGPATVDAEPWITAITGTTMIDPVVVGQPAAIHFQFSGGGGSVFLGAGPGDPNGTPPFTLTTDNGTLTSSAGTGASVGEFINQPDGVLEVTLTASRAGTATISLAGPCGLQDSIGATAVLRVYLPLILRGYASP